MSTLVSVIDMSCNIYNPAVFALYAFFTDLGEKIESIEDMREYMREGRCLRARLI